MRITTISITHARTVNVGNFESVRIEFGATAEVVHGEKHDHVAAELDAYVMRELTLRCPASAVTVKEPGKPAYTSPTAQDIAVVTERVNEARQLESAPKPKRTRRTAAQIEADAFAAFEAKAKAHGEADAFAAFEAKAHGNRYEQGLADVNKLQPDDGRAATGRLAKAEDGPRPGQVPAKGVTAGTTETRATWPDVQAALTAYSRTHGAQNMVKLVHSITGQPNIMAIPEQHWPDVYEAAGGDPLRKAA